MAGGEPGAGPPAPRPGSEAGARAGDGYRSLTFLIDDAGRVSALPHDTYVALAAAGVAAPEFAGGRYRLADWHVRSRDGVPVEVVAEWYGWVAFDGEGRFEPAPPQAPRGPADGGIDPTALPDADELARLRALVFGASGAPGDAG